jgi:hypothetical protein
MQMNMKEDQSDACADERIGQSICTVRTEATSGTGTKTGRPGREESEKSARRTAST